MTGTTAREDAVPVLWSLNGLRAAGALLVMLYHVNLWNLQVIRGSSAFNTGVGLFFVLSGLVLTWTTRPGTSLRAFYTRRVARIYPNHLVTYLLGLAVTVLLVGSAISPGTALAGLLLLQSWSPDNTTVFAVNAVTWSLSCEIAFYAAFPGMLWALRRMTARTRAAVAAVALLVPPAVGVAWPATIPLLFHLPLSRLPEFLLGMVVALAVRDGWQPRLPAPVWLGALAVGVLGAAAVDVHPTVLTAVLAALFAPLAARCAQGDVAGRNRWARHPVVKLAGALSFSFYLLHELVIRTLLLTPLRGWATVPLVLGVSAALAFLLWRCVELPGRARILAAASPTPAGTHETRAARARHGRPRRTAWSGTPASVGPDRAHRAPQPPVLDPAPERLALPGPTRDAPNQAPAAGVASAVTIAAVAAVARGAGWIPPAAPPPRADQPGRTAPAWTPPPAPGRGSRAGATRRP